MGKIRSSNLNKAIDLLGSNKGEGLKNKPKLRRLEKSSNTQCKIVHSYKRIDTQCPVGFSKSGVLSEMEFHASRRNWGQVSSLFLLLLRLGSDIEPLLWRYNFILSLYNNMNIVSNVYQFVQTCIGNLDTAKNWVLRNILSL